MTLMAFEEHLDIADTQEWLNRLQTFLGVQGWTIVRHLPNIQWVITSGFVAGTEHFLEITSNGFGNQTIHIRIRIFNNFAKYRTIEMMLGFGDTSLDTTTATHPVIRFKNPTSGLFENFPFKVASSTEEDLISNIVIPRTWFFGADDKYCCIAMQLDITKTVFIHFGSYEVADLNATYGAFTEGRGDEDWSINVHDTPFDEAFYRSFYKNGATPQGGAAAADFGANFFMSGGNSANNPLFTANFFNTAPGNFATQNVLVSELTPMIRRYLYFKDLGDNLWQYFARSFYYRLNVEGKRIGERFFLGAEEYISFPNNEVDVSVLGVAFRIA